MRASISFTLPLSTLVKNCFYFRVLGVVAPFQIQFFINHLPDTAFEKLIGDRDIGEQRARLIVHLHTVFSLGNTVKVLACFIRVAFNQCNLNLIYLLT